MAEVMPSTARRRYLPDYQVVELKGPVKGTHRVWVREPRLDENGKQMKDESGRKLYAPGSFKDEEFTVKVAWDVYFPRGHSIRIMDRRELEFQGFDKEPAVTDHVLGVKLEGSDEAVELAELARARARLKSFDKIVAGGRLGVEDLPAEAQ